MYLAGTQPELDGATAGLLRTIDSARGQRVGPQRDRWARPPKMAGQPAMRAPRRRAASTARLGALLAALPAAAARPYLGAWVRNDSLAPTFDRRLLSYAPHFHVCRGVLSPVSDPLRSVLGCCVVLPFVKAHEGPGGKAT